MDVTGSRVEEDVKRRPAQCKKRRPRPEVLGTDVAALAARANQAGNGISRQQASHSDQPPAHAPSSFPRRCARLVKEQRARLYIVRRCVTMLACGRD
uniref:Uncharacterized protein n=1 Tax=Leersia perrieri TaxID=77586 RepID=A0A0D9WHA4_9ORYZ